LSYRISAPALIVLFAAVGHIRIEARQGSARLANQETAMLKSLCVVVGVAALTSLSACVVAPVDDRRPPRAVHDEDRDGIPNRVDRDRDGDGVPNRYDRRPDNPYRR
jgi:hypothetical protein